MADAFNALINSNAVAESYPLEELSQHCKDANDSATSAIETLLHSPPEIPLIKSLPTLVFLVCDKPYT